MKHARPEVREDVPASAWTLSEAGREQCPGLAAEIGRFKPTSVIASQEPKATETGELLARELELAFSNAPDLHEHDRTNVGFLTPHAFENAVQDLFARPDEIVFGRESAVQAAARFQRAVDSVVESSVGECPVIVAHGTVISLFVASHTGCDPYELWARLGLPSFVVVSLPERALVHVAAGVPADRRSMGSERHPLPHGGSAAVVNVAVLIEERPVTAIW